MNKEETIEILSGLLRYEAVKDDNNYYVDVPIEDLMDDDSICFYRYTVMEDGDIQVEKRKNSHICGSAVKKSLRQIIWKICKLNQVCSLYKKNYEKWKAENSDIPYIETIINDDSDGMPEQAFEFMRNFWGEEAVNKSEYHRNLRLLLAEYGIGKTSYCNGIRYLVAEEIKAPFLNSNAAFPFVFDLNEFRSGDFDKFIETELFGKYNVPLVYHVFERLCQQGIFMVVLDAWDQMRGARQIYPVNQDLNQMSSLWINKGRALITCRRSFYQQQLKGVGKEKLSQNVGLYKLNGFDKTSVKDYLRKDAQKRRLKGILPLIEDECKWVESCWDLNSELLAKPLNLRLLVMHFNAISSQIDFYKQKADTYSFLAIVLNDWKEKNHIGDELFLKELISQTLFSGLNRSISMNQFKESVISDNWDSIIAALKAFDFVKIDEREERIEFCLAAFQEFLWAHFALKELGKNPEKLDNKNSLLKNYLLIREVREWICKVLGREKSECLANHISYVKYGIKEDVGFRGANALTLLCDLNRIPFYKEQLDKLKLNLRRMPLMGTDFRGIDLSGADFYGSDLEGADFSYTNLDDVNFDKADLAQTKWREHGWMRKCAFLIKSDVLCVVAGTKSGGVLTYQVNNGQQEIVSLQNDVINDLAGDRGGIYTASSDGWVGYIDKDGNLRNAYIARSGLQSITYTRNESCVYVGADNQGIYRYNWNTGSRQEIEVDQILGTEMDTISDIHYYSDGNREDYVAYTLDNSRLLVLLKLIGVKKAKVVATGSVTGKYRFNDICFADGMLVYSVVGKGVFGILVEEAIGDIPERELLDKHQELLPLAEAGAFSLSWANERKTLMVVAKNDNNEIDIMYSIDLASDNRVCTKIQLDWFSNNTNYSITSDNLGGFSISDDGEFAAFSGKYLALLKNMGGYYGLLGKPVETKISCKGTKIDGCSGMTESLKKFFEKRGALLKKNRNEGQYDEQREF